MPPIYNATIPAFVNCRAGTAAAAEAALRAAGLAPRLTEPDALPDLLRAAVAEGAPRIIVSGGDGTVATAASLLARTPTELAVLPGGTLNHFARDHGIPTELPEAARLAVEGTAFPVDVASVNGRVFLNTSSVGAYVLFVRRRERLERWLGYRLASLGAILGTLGRAHPFEVRLEAAGETRRYRSPMVFVGVGERELQIPTLGGRVPGGRHGLHVYVVTGKTRRALLRFALRAVVSGTRSASHTPHLDVLLVDGCRLDMRRRRGNVATDGEITPLEAPLAYALWPAALRLVRPVPPPLDGAAPSS